jgi:ATP-dependent helicase/nuclease subunit B
VCAPLAIEDEDARIIPWPKEQDAGGSGTLRMQAACPFSAFATIRLGARELERAEWGLDPAERGQVLHWALDGVWGELKDRDALIHAKASGHLRAIVEAHVNQALAKYEKPEGEESRRESAQQSEDDQQDQWSLFYLQAERERVVKLVEEWLTFEELRTPFLVAEREQKLSANVGELKLKLRADRIDEVAGGQLLIDYKTGKVSAKAWEGERPDEPQLPLYAAYGDLRSLRGVLLAHIRTGDLKFDGCVEEPSRTLSPGMQRFAPYSVELRQQWERVLLALGEEFLQGEARVDPKNYPETCKLCPLPGLCRVAEMKLEEVEAEQNGLDDGPGRANASQS